MDLSSQVGGNYWQVSQWNASHHRRVRWKGIRDSFRRAPGGSRQLENWNAFQHASRCGSGLCGHPGKVCDEPDDAASLLNRVEVGSSA